MKKQNVLHLLPSNSFSGAENVVCTIIENDKKYNMYYCCPNGPIEEVLKERNIKYIPIKKLTPKNLKKICKEYDINIIHSHDYKASLCSALTSFKGKKISHLHVNWDFNNTWNIYTITYKLILKKFDKIITVSNEVLNNAVYVRGNEKKFVIIKNVVDKKRVIERSKEFKTDKYDIIYVGRIVDVKNPHMIIEITKKLSKKYPNIKTCIIGTGNLENELKILIKNYNLEKNIFMLGFKKNPFPYEKNSKVAILPSKAEGLPMSIIESMILDIPVLNSGVDGMKTLFKNNTDFICTNLDDYCKKIDSIMSGDITLKMQCKDIIKEATDMDNYIKQINKVYE